jgi:hypothetical protein
MHTVKEEDALIPLGLNVTSIVLTSFVGGLSPAVWQRG